MIIPLIIFMLQLASSTDRFITLETGKSAFLETPALPKSINLTINIPAINWTANDQPCFKNGSMENFSHQSTTQLFELIDLWVKETFPKSSPRRRHRRCCIGDPIYIKNWGLRSRSSSRKKPSRP